MGDQAVLVWEIVHAAVASELGHHMLPVDMFSMEAGCATAVSKLGVGGSARRIELSITNLTSLAVGH